MIKKIFVSVVMVMILGACNFQSTPNCEEVLKKSLLGSMEEVQNNIRKLRECEIINEDDELFLLEGEMLGPIIVKSSQGKVEATVQDLLNGYNDLKKDPKFEEIFPLSIKMIRFNSQVATSQNWEEQKEILKRPEMGLEPKDIEEIEELVLNNTEKLTYKALFQKWNESQIVYGDAAGEMETRSIGIANSYSGLKYEEALEKARSESKILIMYFTSWSDINSRKLEEQMFTGEMPTFLKDHFLTVIYFVDERTELPKEEHYFSKTLNKDITNTGWRNLDLEVSMFQNDTQPFFAFISPEGKVLKTAGYTEDFRAVLEEVLGN